MDRMNETNESIILSTNISTIEECIEETTTSLIQHLVSLVRMEQTQSDDHQNEATKYEVTVSHHPGQFLLKPILI